MAANKEIKLHFGIPWGTQYNRSFSDGITLSEEYFNSVNLAEDTLLQHEDFLSLGEVFVTSAGQNNRAGDEAALEALYADTQGTTADGTGWATSTGWASSGMSLSDSIHGVTVADVNGELRVIEINLQVNNLSGSLPEELENLKECTLFDVRENWLTGVLPDGLWNMTKLQYLQLEGRTDNPPDYVSGGYHPGKTVTATNDFTGQLPSEIGNLTSLIEFWLERQGSMTGSIPSTIGNCTELKFFSIYGLERDYVTGFSGSIPSEIGNCTKLWWFLIGRNQIGGTLPSELGNCTEMRQIWCGGTNLTGNIPLSFASMTEIKFFFHDYNAMGGVLPSFVFDGTWSKLNTFSHNYPQNIDGDVSGWFIDFTSIDWGNVPNLQHFSVPRNAISGSLNSTITDIDPEIFNFGFTDNESNESLSGSLPQSGYGNWSNTRYWRIVGHGLTGAIPTGYGSIERLRFSDNNFSSFDSAAMIGVPQLEMVEVESNRLTPKDIVPGIGSLPDYSYDSQKAFDDLEDVELTTGQNYTIDKSHQDYTNNTYQWYKDGSPISGETSHTLQLANVQSSDAGDYTLRINHPSVTQEFESRPITITVI